MDVNKVIVTEAILLMKNDMEIKLYEDSKYTVTMYNGVILHDVRLMRIQQDELRFYIEGLHATVSVSCISDIVEVE